MIYQTSHLVPSPVWEGPGAGARAGAGAGTGAAATAGAAASAGACGGVGTRGGAPTSSAGEPRRRLDIPNVLGLADLAAVSRIRRMSAAARRIRRSSWRPGNMARGGQFRRRRLPGVAPMVAGRRRRPDPAEGGGEG